MNTYTLHKEQFIARPLAEVFAFFENPANLSTITPPWLGFSIVSPAPLVMNEGAVFDYSVRALGIRMYWKSVITEYAPPFRFVDVQVKGPYKHWHHIHTFSEVNGGTLITDKVTYSLPLGVIGALIRNIFVEKQLQEIFSYRSEVIDRIFTTRKVAT